MKKIIKILLIVLAIVLRLYFFDYETLDYINFLSKWIDFFRSNGGLLALKYSIGNYNIPYLYFLAIFSYLPIKDLYLIKLLSCVFDLLLALVVGKLSEKIDGNFDIAFFFTLFAPTVLINSAVWAQCDAIYVAFGLWFIYWALDDKPIFAMICAALSFGFKLQAVFILPVAIIFLIARKIKPIHFCIFPITYFFEILPAVLLGRPFKEAFLLYFNQANSVGDAPNYNAPSLTALTQSIPSSLLIVFAFISMLTIFAIAFAKRTDLNNKSILLLSILMITIIPFLLPHMHDRYFYASDVLSIALISALPLSFIPALLIQFASLICYIAYLKTYYIPIGRIYLTNDYGAIAVLISILIYISYLINIMHIQKQHIR